MLRPLSGAVDSLVLAGTAIGVSADETGPEIAIGFKGLDGFRSGDTILSEAVLEVVISDRNGINITGETGHEMELWVDDQRFIVTEYFHNIGDYRSGLLEFPAARHGNGYPYLASQGLGHVQQLVAGRGGSACLRGGRGGAFPAAVPPEPDAGPGRLHLHSPSRSGVRPHQGVLARRKARRRTFRHGSCRPSTRWPGTLPGELANGTYLYQVEVELADGGRIERKAAIQVMK